MQNTLPELVAMVSEIDTQEQAAETAGNTLPEDLYYQREILSQLISGKIDQAIELKNALEARVDALTDALSRANGALEKIEFAFNKTLDLTGQTRIDGLAWHVRRQKNSRASVVVEDEEKIPDANKLYALNISRKFPIEEREYLYWSSVLLRKPMTKESLAALSDEDKELLNSALVKVLDKGSIESALKAKQEIPGAKLEQGFHLRFGKGESRPKAIAAEAK